MDGVTIGESLMLGLTGIGVDIMVGGAALGVTEQEHADCRDKNARWWPYTAVVPE